MMNKQKLNGKLDRLNRMFNSLSQDARDYFSQNKLTPADVLFRSHSSGQNHQEYLRYRTGLPAQSEKSYTESLKYLTEALKI